MESDIAYWVALRSYEKFGPRSFERLCLHFRTMKEAFEAPREAFLAAGITPNAIEGFLGLRDEIHPESLMQELEHHHICVLTKRSTNYPKLLSTIYDAPPVLFLQGPLPPDDQPTLAIVGSRKASPYGLRVAAQFAGELADAGVVVVSGLAWGIDEAAHMATVKHQGVTVAVLASGHAALTGRQRYLAAQILEHRGAILSEFLPNVSSFRHHFPIRNRIISGMSQGTLVVEAIEKSGSLITAKSAIDQGRDVFAIPGPIDSPTSVGTHALLKAGAYPTTVVSDILDVLHIESRAPEATITRPMPDTKEEAILLPLLSKTPIHIDALAKQAGLPMSAVLSSMTLMQLKGRIREVGGMHYILV
ncbi:MAG: DNA-processing protein DprA [Patescibacteria group bacterium]|jgi:DNA processing protein